MSSSEEWVTESEGDEVAAARRPAERTEWTRRSRLPRRAAPPPPHPTRVRSPPPAAPPPPPARRLASGETFSWLFVPLLANACGLPWGPRWDALADEARRAAGGGDEGLGLWLGAVEELAPFGAHVRWSPGPAGTVFEGLAYCDAASQEAAVEPAALNAVAGGRESPLQRLIALAARADRDATLGRFRRAAAAPPPHTASASSPLPLLPLRSTPSIPPRPASAALLALLARPLLPQARAGGDVLAPAAFRLTGRPSRRLTPLAAAPSGASNPVGGESVGLAGGASAGVREVRDVGEGDGL